VVAPNPGYPVTPENGDFTAGTDHWTLWLASGGPAASLAVQDGALKATIPDGGADYWNVQVSYAPGIDLVQGTSYRLSFDAWADAPRSIYASVHENGRDLDGDGSAYRTYAHGLPELGLTSTAQTFQLDFTMPLTNRAATVDFFLGGSTVGVHLDNVTVTEVAPYTTGTVTDYALGSDATPFTSDDFITSWSSVQYAASGGSHLAMGYGSRGLDGAWKTADDVVGWQWWEPGDGYGLFVNSYGALQSCERYDVTGTATGDRLNELYDDQGLASGWSDAHLTGYYKRKLNANGGEERRERYDDAGLDGVWFTDDDVLTSVVVRHFPGTNGDWDSWDQATTYDGHGVVQSCATHEFGEGTQRWTLELRYAPGPDGTCFTGDDVLQSYSTATHVYPAP
jgi:hypothetical protein